MSMSFLLEIKNNMDFLKACEKRGFVSSKLFRYKNIMERYRMYEIQGHSPSDIVVWVSDEFDCSQKTVYNALNALR